MKKSKIYLWIIILILLVLIAVLLTINDHIPDSCCWKNYFMSLPTTIFGIMVSIILIEIIIAKARKQEQNDLSYKKAKRIVLALKPFIRNYQNAAIVISNKIMEMSEHPTIRKNFPFTNLAELYEPQILVMEPLRKSKVELYFEKVDRLKDIIMNIVLNVDLTAFPKLYELLVGYIEEMERDYPKNVLLKYQNLETMSSHTKITQIISQKIKNYNGGEIKDDHLLMPVKRLYDIILFHIDFIDNYNKICPQISDFHH